MINCWVIAKICNWYVYLLSLPSSLSCVKIQSETRERNDSQENENEREYKKRWGMKTNHLLLVIRNFRSAQNSNSYWWNEGTSYGELQAVGGRRRSNTIRTDPLFAERRHRKQVGMGSCSLYERKRWDESVRNMSSQAKCKERGITEIEGKI